MSTVDKSFVFASDNEGLVGTLTAWLSSDGSPDNGCLNFTGGYTAAGYALKSSTADTWETWGVPAGATVTNVQLTEWKYKIPIRSRFSNPGSFAIVSSDGTTIATLSSVLTMAAVVSSWTAGSAGSSQSVGSSYQASTTPVRLKIVWPQGGLADGDLRIDTLVVTITYTGGTTFKQSRSLLGVGW